MGAVHHKCAIRRLSHLAAWWSDCPISPELRHISDSTLLLARELAGAGGHFVGLRMTSPCLQKVSGYQVRLSAGPGESPAASQPILGSCGTGMLSTSEMKAPKSRARTNAERRMLCTTPCACFFPRVHTLNVTHETS